MIGILMACLFLSSSPPVVEPQPMEQDIFLFPQTTEWLQAETARADQFRSYLEKLVEIDRANADEIHAAIAEITRRRDLYLALRWLKLPPLTGEVQVRNLRDLRDRLGWQCYYAGIMPPIVPVEYYRSER